MNYIRMIRLLQRAEVEFVPSELVVRLAAISQRSHKHLSWNAISAQTADALSSEIPGDGFLSFLNLQFIVLIACPHRSVAMCQAFYMTVGQQSEDRERKKQHLRSRIPCGIEYISFLGIHVRTLLYGFPFPQSVDGRLCRTTDNIGQPARTRMMIRNLCISCSLIVNVMFGMR